MKLGNRVVEVRGFGSGQVIQFRKELLVFAFISSPFTVKDQ